MFALASSLRMSADLGGIKLQIEQALAKNAAGADPEGQFFSSLDSTLYSLSCSFFFTLYYLSYSLLVPTVQVTHGERVEKSRVKKSERKRVGVKRSRKESRE